MRNPTYKHMSPKDEFAATSFPLFDGKDYDANQLFREFYICLRDALMAQELPMAQRLDNGMNCRDELSNKVVSKDELKLAKAEYALNYVFSEVLALNIAAKDKAQVEKRFSCKAEVIKLKTNLCVGFMERLKGQDCNNVMEFIYHSIDDLLVKTCVGEMSDSNSGIWSYFYA